MKISAVVLVLALGVSNAFAFAPATINTRASTVVYGYLDQLNGSGRPGPSPSQGGQMVPAGATPAVQFGGPVNGGLEGSSVVPQAYEQVDSESPYGTRGFNPVVRGQGGQTRQPRMRQSILPRVTPINGNQVMTTGGIEGSKKVWSVYQGPNGSS